MIATAKAFAALGGLLGVYGIICGLILVYRFLAECWANFVSPSNQSHSACAPIEPTTHAHFTRHKLNS